MGSTGQTIGGIAGAVLGAYLGQGAGGAYVGFSLGMMLGSIIDPPRGQRLAPDFSRSDVYYNAVGRNTPVPIVYGVNRVGGNLIWLAPKGTRLTSTDAKKEGGSGGGGGGGSKKGGGGTDQRAVIDIDWAIALSEGEIEVVSDVFLGDDVAQLTDGMDYTAYLGTQTQSADLRVVADLGALAPAFRNLAYLTLSAELESPSLPTVSAEIQGIGGVFAGDAYGGVRFQDAFAGRSLVQADGSFLVLGNENYMARSTDYGETWSQVNCGLNVPGAGYVGTTAIADHPGVAGRVYAMCGNFINGGGLYIYRSDDYGRTWTNTSNLLEPTFDAGALLGIRGNSSEVLAFSRSWAYEYTSAIWRSTDGGTTFTEVCRPAGAGWYGGVVAAIHIPDSDTVYGLCRQWGGPRASQLFVSHDRGASWEVKELAPIQAVPDGGFVFNENVFGFVGNAADTGAGACYETFDGGATWTLFPVGGDELGSARINSFGLLVAVSQATTYPDVGVHTYFSTTLGRTWRRFDVDLDYDGYHVPFDWWFGGRSMQALWLTTEQVCLGSGVPGYITCVDFTVPTSCGNPALIIRDLLTNPRYGLGINSSRIHGGSFKSASAYCTAQVPSRLSSGHLEQRFCLDYIVDQQIPIVDHLRDMLATFGGYLTWSQGTVKLKIDMPSSCCQSFGMADIVANSFQWKQRGYRDRPNVVRVDYVEPGNTVYYATPQDVKAITYFIQTEEGTSTGLSVNKNYKTYKHDFVEASDPWDIDVTGERRERVLNLVGIKRRSQAQRMAEYYLAKALHCQHTCVFRVSINALKAEVGDVIAVTHEVPRWAGKQFRIVEVQEAENDELTLGCVEYNDAVFRAVAGQPPGQPAITGDLGQRLLAAPYHVARLTAYERPYEDAIEINYTRLATGDLFGGVYLYKRVGEDGAWVRQDAKLSLAPTAYLASHLHTVTLVQS